MIGELLLLVLLVASAFALWRVWVAGAREAQRADEAARQAAEARRLVEGAERVCHDLANLLSAAFTNLEDAEEDEDPAEVDMRMARIARALRSSTELLDAFRASIEDGTRPASTRGHVLLQVALLRHRVGFKTSITGDLDHHGASASAGRLVQSLLVGAARQAELAGGPVTVELTNAWLRIISPHDRSGGLPEAGEADSGEDGLAVAMAEAAVVGWSITHQSHGDTVTVEVRPEPRG